MAHTAYQEEAPSVVDDLDLSRLQRQVTRVLEQREVTFSGERFTIDPVPRVIDVDEWRLLETGLKQRVRALSAFVRDVYGERAIVRAGVVPERVIESADHHERAMRGAPLVGPIAVAGLDIVRDETGEFLVLEDNVRTPSGLAYAVAAREALDACLAPPAGRRDLAGVMDLLGAALRAAALDGNPDPNVVVLTDGPENSAYFEHGAIARHLGFPLVTIGDLRRRGDSLFADVRGKWERVDVVYRRTNDDRLDEPVGRALHDTCVDGAAAVVNAYGAGVADDKLAHAYVEDMVRFYLGEEPALRSVPTYDLGLEAVREDVLARTDEVVIKPRSASGGEGILIGPLASPAEREAAAEAVLDAPEDWVAQEMISLSCHPTLWDGRLEPRHVDLRAFVFLAGDDAAVFPGGLTRVALEPGSVIVNSSQGGGAKDTWVSTAPPADTGTTRRRPDAPGGVLGHSMCQGHTFGPASLPDTTVHPSGGTRTHESDR